MELDNDSCYQAILTHDARFDGAFFVGVKTTKIYCRTVCPSRTPRRESCTFYLSAAAAEVAGFRPCLRCRPELAPGNARIDSISRLAAAIAERIEDGALTTGTIETLAAALGVSDRHLRRVTETAFGVSPVELAQTQRLLLAKRLLTDTNLPITEIAFASGFSSLRRFNALFKERYRLNPTDLRRTRKSRDQPADSLICEVGYRPPLDFDSLLRYLHDRSIAGVEAVVDNRYVRTVSLGNAKGWIAVGQSQRKHTLCVEISTSLAALLPPILSRVKRIFDVSAEPLTIAERLGAIAVAPGLRVPGTFDSFELAVRTILGQQISVRAATTVSGRFAAKFGEPIDTLSRQAVEVPFPQLTHLSPRAETVARAEVDDIAALGIVGARARSIIALARVIADGSLALDPGNDVEGTMACLKTLPGIGEWTAQYIAMRALRWPDAFPHTDLGIYKALDETNPKRVLALAEEWRPWRSYATMHLWKSLETIQ